ncbi:MAG: hypothetical protein U0835_26115 [Isosphaeraceae bacterium]
MFRMLPGWRFGRPSVWLGWHVAAAVLGLALVGAHANWGANEPLTTGIWVLLGLILVSGVHAARRQHELPGEIAALLPLDVPATVLSGDSRRYLPGGGPWLGQVELARHQLWLQADLQAEEARRWLDRPGTEAGEATVSEVRPAASFRPQFDAAYNNQIRPFLTAARPGRSVLCDPVRSAELFQRLRLLAVAPALVQAVTRLEQACDTRRKYERLRVLNAQLQGPRRWHGLLTAVLAVLTVVHACLSFGKK